MKYKKKHCETKNVRNKIKDGGNRGNKEESDLHVKPNLIGNENVLKLQGITTRNSAQNLTKQKYICYK
jgi:hypothetical protein